MKGTAANNGTCRQEGKPGSATVRNWWHQSRARQTFLCAGGCLTLALPLLYRLVIASAGTSGGIGPEESMKEPALLDSFSEPSVALALLKQEADRLLLVYLAKRDREEASQWVKAEGRLTLAARPGTHEGIILPAASANPLALQTPEIQSLLALDARVWDLHLDLSPKALNIYVNQHLWRQFVDRYLQIVRESPERSEVETYFRCALECAEECGRAEEVAEVLQRLSQAHPELKRLAHLKEPLADWKAAHPPSPQIARR